MEWKRQKLEWGKVKEGKEDEQTSYSITKHICYKKKGNDSTQTQSIGHH